MSAANLELQIKPQGEIETLTFNRYLHAIEQCERFRLFEIEAQQRWLNEPENQLWFQQMERIQKLAALQERRADNALRQLCKLQADRFSSMDVHSEIYLLGKKATIPASLPIADLLRKRPAHAVAAMILTNEPESWNIIQNPYRPPEQAETANN